MRLCIYIGWAVCVGMVGLEQEAHVCRHVICGHACSDRRGVVLTYIVSMLTHVYKVTTSVASSVAARTMRRYARGCGRVKPTETSQTVRRWSRAYVRGDVRCLVACV